MISALLTRAKLLHRAGDLLQAETLYRQVLMQVPSHAEALYLLAGTCHAQGKLAEAVTHYQQALGLNPQSGEYHRNLAVALHQMGRIEEAMACLQEALRLNSEDAEAYFWLGHFFIERLRFEESIEALQIAIRLKPALFKAHSELGLALRLDGRANAYHEALRLQPADSIALGRLGAALSEGGKIPEAIATYHEALRFRPDHALALHNLGELARQGLYRYSDEELSRVHGLLEKKNLAGADRSLLCFALAYHFESVGDYDAAFSFFIQGNDLRKRSFHERGLGFDREARAAWVERAISFFTPEYFTRVAAWGLDSDIPIFVVGMPRSGTTLVEQVLASHPQVHGAGELMYIQRLTEDLPRTLGTTVGYPECLADCDSAIVRKLGERYLEQLRAKGGDAPRVVDKMPDNYLHLGLIATLFSRVRVVWCRRGALDTCVSCYTQSFHATPWTWDLLDIASCYQAYERLMAQWQSVLPIRIFEVHYEDFVQNQEAITRQLIQFCGLQWDNRCLAFERSHRPVQTASRLQVQQRMHTRSIGKWRRYQKHLTSLVDALRQTSQYRLVLG